MNASELKFQMDMLLNDDNIFFGLDFGSYRSLIAYKRKGEFPKIADYSHTKHCSGGIPSEFWRTVDGREFVGDEVLLNNGWTIDPAGQCPSIKTKLNEKTITINGHDYTPEEIAVKLVQRIKLLSTQVLKSRNYIDMKLKKIVVGIPARFDDPNGATRGTIETVIAKAFGLNPKRDVHLIAEPILAAIANYHFANRSTNKPILAYDMGDGTFDVTVLIPNTNPTSKHPEPFIAIAPDGLTIAGAKLTKCLEELIVEKLNANPGGINLEVINNPNHADRIRLRELAREHKEILSESDSTTIIVSGIECGCQFVEIKRSEFEAKIAPLIKKTVELSFEVLKKSGLGDKPDIDILLTGGSTCIPLIKKMLKEKFNWIPENNFIDLLRYESVSLGAALYAESIANSDVALVAPKVSYGYAVKSYSPAHSKDVLVVQIPSGADLPVRVKGNYSPRFKLRVISFEVYEIHTGKENEYLDVDQGKPTKYVIEHDFGKTVDTSTTVELTTTLSKNGILTMKVDDFGITPKPTEKTFTLTNIIPEEK